jgi:signal transduction histidine kinase
MDVPPDLRSGVARFFWPRHLRHRIALALIAILLLAQGAGWSLFRLYYERQFVLLTAEQLGAPMAAAFQAARQVLGDGDESDPGGEMGSALLAATRGTGLSAHWLPGDPPPPLRGWHRLDATLPFARIVLLNQGALRSSLIQDLPLPAVPLSDDGLRTLFSALSRELAASNSATRLFLEAAPSHWIEIASPRYWRDHGTPVEMLLAEVATLTFLIWFSFWLAGWLVRDVEALESQITASSDHGAPQVVSPGGATMEVIAITRAINETHATLNDQMEGRTQLLAAISHDLRTPATRLRLRVEYIEDDTLRAKILGDVDELSRMISSALEFFNDDALREETETVSFSSLLQSLCDDYADMGQPVVLLETPPLRFAAVRTVFGGADHQDSLKFDRQLRLSGRPSSLRRAFANLIDNAITYGERATVAVDADADEIMVEITDNGPGIPDEEMKNVFKPFFRLDRSRNRKTGGVGLGLSIVKSIIEIHQGQIEMFNRLEGGLTVRVTLPRML